MTYCDYDFYKNKYSGALPELVFNRLAIQASAEIRKNTFNRIDINNVQKEVQYCTCELVDYINKISKQDGKKSESVSSWSIMYADKAEVKQTMHEIIRNHLADIVDSNGTYLMYRGL